MVKDVVMSMFQTHLYSRLPFGDLKSFVRRYKKDSLVMFFWGQPREVGRQFVKDHGVNYQGAQ